MSELNKSLRLMVVNGLRLELPSEPLSNYAEVKRTLVKAGGKYAKNGFVFTSDPQEVVDRLCGGEKVNPKKTFQFFPTPDTLARQLAISAGIERHHTVLEPSAGDGAILKHLANMSGKVSVVELNPEHIPVLLEFGVDVTEGDFLDFDKTTLGMFDRIVANPPFTKNQDIQHVKHMYDLLNDGGRMVTVMSQSWLTGSQKMQQEFREWVFKKPHSLNKLEAGVFSGSGTKVASVILIIDKR